MEGVIYTSETQRECLFYECQCLRRKFKTSNWQAVQQKGKVKNIED